MNSAQPAIAGFRHQRVTALRPEGASTACLLADSGSVLISPYVAGFIAAGDEIEYAVCAPVGGTEIRVCRQSGGRSRELYLAPIGYVTQPKQDKRQETFLRADVANADGLGVRRINLPAATVRDHFYRADRTRGWPENPTFYELLNVPTTAAPADLRLAYKVRRLEIQSAGGAAGLFRNIERAFNLLMNPQARACYDRMLLDPDADVLFPNGGFGQIFVAGELARDRTTFFAQRIVSFRPDSSQRRFRAPLRRVDFLHDHAIYRDPRRKVEVFLDRGLLPLAWDPTWNQWKHLVRAKIGIDALCVKSGAYRFLAGDWQFVSWSSAVPSRTVVSLPADIEQQIQGARRTFQRFGRFSRELERIRMRLESEPMEKRELDGLCAELGIPGDFDVAQISWKPDYDPFYYDQLRKRARKIYLLRAEYILELERAVVVEVPALGHATYIFAPPHDANAFVRLYATTTKENIRKNRDGIAERLGFLGRVTHGADARAWLRELKRRVGESVDYAATTLG